MRIQTELRPDAPAGPREIVLSSFADSSLGSPGSRNCEYSSYQLASGPQCPGGASADGHCHRTIAMTEPAGEHTENQQHIPSNDDNSALRDLSAKLHLQVTAFLQEDVKTERLKAVQAQVRHSLAVIQEAIDTYE